MIFPKKPKFGEKCNNCGICCAVEICDVGEEIFGIDQKAPCPALMQVTECKTKKTKLVCHIVMLEKASKLKPIIQELLGIGEGCGMEDE